jgi:ribonuclease HI
MTEVTIYTDGACKGNPGNGGWGALLTTTRHRKEIFGGEINTTNNRMELTAVIEALSTLKRACTVHLFTDSKYVLQGLTEWLPNWKNKHWKTASGKPVKNQDLWEALDRAVQRHTIHWHWVKGHAGNTGNECADALANKGILSITTDTATINNPI